MQPIPIMQLPLGACGFDFKEEEMLDAEKYFHGEVLVEPIYFLSGIEGASPKCLIRKSVAERLESAVNSLESGLALKIWDAWRPVAVQKSLYTKYYRKVKAENPMLSESELAERTKQFVSLPSENAENPAVHNSGGAVDLTICEVSNGNELDMGTKFDDFTELAHTAYFETHNNTEVRDNRRYLYHLMRQAGFTNYPAEWWHYDFGDAFWSFYTQKPSLYRGIINSQ